jgi:molybdopterin biosynthesis enzyme
MTADTKSNERSHVESDELAKIKKSADGRLTEEDLSVVSGGASVGDIVIVKTQDASSTR